MWLNMHKQVKCTYKPQITQLWFTWWALVRKLDKGRSKYLNTKLQTYAYKWEGVPPNLGPLRNLGEHEVSLLTSNGIWASKPSIHWEQMNYICLLYKFFCINALWINSMVDLNYGSNLYMFWWPKLRSNTLKPSNALNEKIFKDP